MTPDADIRREALRLLGRREHSRAELERKLSGRGHEPGAVVAVLDALEASRLLSDERMAEAYVAERLRRGFGPVRVRLELRQRGLDDAQIEPLLQRSPEHWLELMNAVAHKRFGPGAIGDRKELARRARFLEYRGFPSELVGRFLRGQDPD